MSIDNRKKKEELKEVVAEALAETVEPVVNLEEVAPNEEPNKETEVKTEEVIEEKQEEVKVEEPKPSPDYKEKYQESSKESLTQYFKNKKLTSVIEEANNLPEPSEDELIVFARSKGTNYDDLDDFSKAILKETLWNKNKTNKINEVVIESREIDVWADKVDVFANSVETIAKYPLIEENADEFKKFCMKSARRGMDLEDLSTSFLYGLSNMTPKKVVKGSMLLSGGSSGGKEEKPVGITDEDARNIRTTNPKEYRRLVKAGKIKIEI
jgi:hypothetical protein